MIVKEGEVICIASGIFEGYDRAGPFKVMREFDLDDFVEKITPPVTKPWEIASLMSDIPRIFLEHGLITKMTCKNVYLGAWGSLTSERKKTIFEVARSLDRLRMLSQNHQAGEEIAMSECTGFQPHAYGPSGRRAPLTEDCGTYPFS